jgi:probable F420-dependent oxidoreductase
MTTAATPAISFGLALPNYRPGATAEGIAAAAENCDRFGWDSVWTTDHLLIDRSAAGADYVQIFEALTSLAWIGAAHPRLRLGTSVLVVPMRNAVIVAKEIATLDALSGGRVTVGVGVGWSPVEFANVGAGEMFTRRGRYLDEAIALWRHLWSGSTEPFEGRFHSFRDYAFGPLPAQGAALPILVGGRAEAALTRAGALADGYQASSGSPAQLAERAPVVNAAAAKAGRPAPTLSARVRVSLGEGPTSGYVVSGTPQQMLAEIDAFTAVGVSRFVVDFVETDPERHAALFERFHRDVASARVGARP